MSGNEAAFSLEQVGEHYDDLDSWYRGIWGEHVHHGLWRASSETRQQAVVNLVRFVANRARIQSGLHVGDAGCGYGAPARWVANHRGARVTGICKRSHAIRCPDFRETVVQVT